MTKIHVEGWSNPLRVWNKTWGRVTYINVGFDDDYSELSPDEARELVKALKKHIKKAEGK